MIISADVDVHRAEFLRLEYIASAAYNEFVYKDRADADTVRAFLFDKGAAEFSAAFSRVLLNGQEVLGIISCLSAEAVAKCRMRSAYALARGGVLQHRPALRRRLEIAGTTLIKLKPNDFYLSRISVAAAAAGEGLGARLIRYCQNGALKAGASRICLEVSKSNLGAISFYKTHQFKLVGSSVAYDTKTDRNLSYFHMAKDLDAP